MSTWDELKPTGSRERTQHVAPEGFGRVKNELPASVTDSLDATVGTDRLDDYPPVTAAEARSLIHAIGEYAKSVGRSPRIEIWTPEGLQLNREAISSKSNYPGPVIVAAGLRDKRITRTKPVPASLPVTPFVEEDPADLFK